MLDEMRLFKSDNEIALMQQAGQISALAHIRAMQKHVQIALNMKLKGSYCMNLTVLVRVFHLIMRLLPVVKMPVFCITLKMICH